MASEILAAEETRERRRWNESSKVYSRKIKNKKSSSASRSAGTNGDTWTVSHGTAYVDNNGAVATSIGGDFITANNCGVRIASKCNGVASNSGDASTVDNGVTALVNNGNIAGTNDRDFVNDEDDAAMVDSGDTSFADNGDTMISGNGNTGSTGSNSDSGKGSPALEVEDRNSSHLDQIQHSSVLPHQVEPDPSLLQNVTEDHPWQPQQLQETVLPSHKLKENLSLPQQLRENVLSPEQQQEHVPPQKKLQKHVPSMHKLLEPVLRPELISDAPSGFNQMETRVAGISVEGKQNGSMMAIATSIANRVNINLMVSRSSIRELRHLKRKLMEEVAEVRNLVRKLEQKEVQISSHSGGVRIDGVGGDGMHGLSGNSGYYTHMQYPANHATGQVSGIRFYSNESLIGFSNSRTHRQLTVSVMDNSHVEFLEKEKRTPKANQFFSSSDFILGKDKFPHAEGNKKLKSASKKHGGGEINFWFGMDKHITQSCTKLLQKLMRHKYGWVFNKPVDVKALHLYDYYDIIKHPMDLGTVKSRLSKNWYKSPQHFAEDVRLTFHNAMAYNPKGHDVHIMAEQLSQIFEEGWVHIEAEYNRRLRYDVRFPTDTSRRASVPLPAYMQRCYVYAPVSPPLHPSPWQEMRTLERSESMAFLPKHIYNGSMGRTPALRKPKANEPNKRNMTFEEKQKLSANLQAMPPEKLDSIVQIIKKRSSTLNLHDDEIEVDIDNVDAETLWELDRLVMNYKKSLSKYKRRAELAIQRTEAAKVFQQANLTSGQAEVLKEAIHAVENNGVSSPVNGNVQPDNASGSSTSSSSSSGSGSSSSDSESDSSSDSSSDEGH